MAYRRPWRPPAAKRLRAAAGAGPAQPSEPGLESPIATTPHPEAATVPLLELFECMTLIRAFETRVAELYRDGEIPGFVHVSLGQEAVAAGVCKALTDEDYVTTTHRGHGHCIAKGLDLDGMMAELFAKSTGLCGGKGGSMHIADPSHGMLGANAIVGASLPLAVGAALSSKLRGQDRVAVAFFGEGAVNQGVFHESVNLAAIWRLPVILACENNTYSEFTDSRTMTLVPSVIERVRGHGVDGVLVDGNDVSAVHRAAGAAALRGRAGEGPVLLELETYRWHGHYEGDAQPYKPSGEEDRWRERDPLLLAEAELIAAGERDADDLAAVRRSAQERVEQAIERARAAPKPAPEDAYAHVFAD